MVQSPEGNSDYVSRYTFTDIRGSWLIVTYPEEFPALLDHVCQAMSGSQVLVQVPLVWLPECLFPVHHPLTTKLRQLDTAKLVMASTMPIACTDKAEDG